MKIEPRSPVADTTIAEAVTRLQTNEFNKKFMADVVEVAYRGRAAIFLVLALEKESKSLQIQFPVGIDKEVVISLMETALQQLKGLTPGGIILPRA